MPEERRTWIPVVPTSEEGQGSNKEVISSDYGGVRAKRVDEGGIGRTRVSYRLSGLWKGEISYKGTDYETFDMIESGHMQEIGSPQIPQEGLYVAIPDNAVFKELNVLDVIEKDLEGDFNVVPAPKPVFEGEEVEYIPSAEVYESDELFPGRHADYVGTKHIAGRKVVHLLVYLAQYRPKSRKVRALESIELEIVYETKPGMDAERKVRTRRATPLDELILDSSSSLEHYPPKLRDAASSADAALKDPDNAADLVIITTKALTESFAIYEAIKTYKHQVMIVTITQILAEFPDPNTDVAIRNFLIYATQNWDVPPETVVLGGDVATVPTHIVTHSGEDIASDHYYADLTGDMCPDISVSRFPASTASAMSQICDVAAYYNRYHGDWRTRVMLTTYNRDDYNECKDQIATTIGNTFTVLKRYDGQASKADVISTIDAGVVFINYRGHGSPTAWSASNGLQNADIPGLANGDMTPHVLSIACLNSDIDHKKTSGGYFQGPCFGETWIQQLKAVTFLGASRPSYTTINHSFDKYLWNGIVNHGLTEAGVIFDWATTQLYLNNPSESTKHNIYMYLLMGDPTADYKEKVMPTQTTVGFALMLDSSGTMHDATSTVKIDAKAFVREARANDQFGVNQFNNNASWIYPTGSSPQIVTVDSQLTQTKAAAQKIESDVHANPMSYLTNLGQAIQLGNGLISQATTDVKAFVILSDGMWNTGPDPVGVLGAQPPIFVAGLGPYLKKEYFDSLLAKNPNSKFYHKPNAWEMMQIFNDIRALPQDVGLASNALDQYTGSDYTLTASTISADSEEAQFVVVWSDARFKYTSGTPSGFNINVVLIDPDGKTSSEKPVITDAGYCIFNLMNVKPGTWRTLVQYSVPQSVYGTSGGFQFDTLVNLQLSGPSLHKVGEALEIKAHVLDEGKPVEGLTAHARVTQPILSIEHALEKYARDLNSVKLDKRLIGDEVPEKYARLLALRNARLSEEDILAAKRSYRILEETEDGAYGCVIRDTREAGAYSVEVYVKGRNPNTGKTFSRTRTLSTLVG